MRKVLWWSGDLYTARPLCYLKFLIKLTDSSIKHIPFTGSTSTNFHFHLLIFELCCKWIPDLRFLSSASMAEYSMINCVRGLLQNQIATSKFKCSNIFFIFVFIYPNV